ncbi:MAG: GPI anchored serine-threonine rich family protein [Ignavibacteriaceae bacterium]
MKVIILVQIVSVICLTILSGCRQIFGDREQPESIVQVPPDYSQIVVTAPEKGSIWKPGDVIRIKWLATSTKNVDIQLYRKSAYQFTIKENFENTGLFDWSIPFDINLSNHYLVKIINHNNPDVFQFSGRFGIQQ